MLKKYFSLENFVKKEAQYDYSGDPGSWGEDVLDDWGRDDLEDWEDEQVFKNREMDRYEGREDETYLTIEPNTSGGGFKVVLHGTYEKSSVLAGEPKYQTIGFFDTVEEALLEHRDAEVIEHSTKPDVNMPIAPPRSFDSGDADEKWDEDY